MGTRGTDIGKQLWDKIKSKNISKIMTDYWKAYDEFLPQEKHFKSKMKLLQLRVIIV
jgi:IS1 family transposase